MLKSLEGHRLLQTEYYRPIQYRPIPTNTVMEGESPSGGIRNWEHSATEISTRRGVGAAWECTPLTRHLADDVR